MLARFATGASFSSDSKGRGKESNSKFLPYMIQMARHLLYQSTSSQRRTMSTSISSYLTSSSTSDSRPSPSSPLPPSPTPTEDTVQFMVVTSLLTESYDSWLKHCPAFLQRGIYHAYMQHSHSRPVPPTILKPRKSKSNMDSGEGTFKQAEGGDDESGLEGWEVVMKEKLLKMKEMVSFSKELLSWLDDMNSVGDLQEAFDVIGALSDVLSSGSKSCEEFFQAAINAGES